MTPVAVAVASPSPAPAAAFLDEAQALACIHCGLCLASCPTYLETGDENQSPRGRIHRMRALQDGRLALGAETVQPIDQCLGCRACEAVCPSGVPYGELLEHTRDHVERHHRRGGWQTFLRRVAIEQVFPFPERLEVALAPARAVRALGLERLLPARLREALALVPTDLEPVELPAWSPACSPAAPTAGAPASGVAGPAVRAGLLAGCAMRVMFGGTNRSTLELLNEAGYDVVNPADQGCCGALHAHGGQLDEARRLARRNIECFERAGIDVLVVNAAGCGSTLKEYGTLLAHDPAWAARAARFASRVRDLTEVLPVPPARAGSTGAAGSGGAGTTGKVTYHDACHLCHAQRIRRPPRDLVKAVAGSAYVELPEAEVCCGSAGTYNLTEPEMAARLQERKVGHILRTGATTVVTTNPGCLLQIRAGLAAAGADHVEAVHLADYLRRAGRPDDGVGLPRR